MSCHVLSLSLQKKRKIGSNSSMRKQFCQRDEYLNIVWRENDTTLAQNGGLAG
jgi:hypothetical protein